MIDTMPTQVMISFAIMLTNMIFIFFADVWFDADPNTKTSKVAATIIFISVLFAGFLILTAPI